MNIKFCREITAANIMFFMVFSRTESEVKGAVEEQAERERCQNLHDFHVQFTNQQISRIILSYYDGSPKTTDESTFKSYGEYLLVQNKSGPEATNQEEKNHSKESSYKTETEFMRGQSYETSKLLEVMVTQEHEKLLTVEPDKPKAQLRQISGQIVIERHSGLSISVNSDFADNNLKSENATLKNHFSTEL